VFIARLKTELVIFITPRIVTEKLTEEMLQPEKKLSEKSFKKNWKLIKTKKKKEIDLEQRIIIEKKHS